MRNPWMRRPVLAAALALAGISPAHAQKSEPAGESAAAGAIDWCAPTTNVADAQKRVSAIIREFGGSAIDQPENIEVTEDVIPLKVTYAKQMVSGCLTDLRRYNGQLTGPTYRIRPGQTLPIDLTNALPKGTAAGGHAGHSMPGVEGNILNVTNFHSHGWHVDPNGESDNVLRTMTPSGKPYRVRIKLPEYHPAGTFWYHAHQHGSTATQVSSGMAGVLIVQGGLDEVPVIARTALIGRDLVMLFQQVQYGADGKLEDPETQLNPPGSWGKSGRATLINGQVAPRILMQPGQVVRLRFIHGGVRESLQLRLDRREDGRPGEFIPLNEIAVDGLALGDMVAWPAIEMHPGYRSDVLVKFPDNTPSGTVFGLYDDPVGTTYDDVTSVGALDDRQDRALRTIVPLRAVEGADSDARLLATFYVGGPPDRMRLPKREELAPYKAIKHDITPDQATGKAQSIQFSVQNATCDANGVCTPCTSGTGCTTAFTINENGVWRTFNENYALKLKLGQTAKWTLNSSAGQAHPFHIHVNPFQTVRTLPDGSEQTVWRDTLMVGNTPSGVDVYTRYEDFTGRFVLHCHILPHEDEGMMQIVEIVK